MLYSLKEVKAKLGVSIPIIISWCNSYDIKGIDKRSHDWYFTDEHLEQLSKIKKSKLALKVKASNASRKKEPYETIKERNLNRYLRNNHSITAHKQWTLEEIITFRTLEKEKTDANLARLFKTTIYGVAHMRRKLKLVDELCRKANPYSYEILIMKGEKWLRNLLNQEGRLS